MQHADLRRLAEMDGIEYALIHVQDPILYVIQVIIRLKFVAPLYTLT